jgi:hypothetical protein
MKSWILSNKLYGIGAIVGAIAGFLYWKYIGCLTGSCAITSNPFRSTIYFALMGSLLFGMFKRTQNQTSALQSEDTTIS